MRREERLRKAKDRQLQQAAAQGGVPPQPTKEEERSESRPEAG